MFMDLIHKVDVILLHRMKGNILACMMNFFQQDEVPLNIRPIGDFLYLWYACFGKLEVYLNKEILCSVERTLI